MEIGINDWKDPGKSMEDLESLCRQLEEILAQTDQHLA